MNLSLSTQQKMVCGGCCLPEPFSCGWDKDEEQPQDSLLNGGYLAPK